MMPNIIQSEGRVTVSDLGNSRIETFDRMGGRLLRTWGSGGDGEGRFYVVDSGENFRIQIRFPRPFSDGLRRRRFAIDRDGYICVVDSANGRIDSPPSGAMAPEFLSEKSRSQPVGRHLSR